MRKRVEGTRRDHLRDRGQLAAFLQTRLRRGPAQFGRALREAVIAQDGGFAEIARRTGHARTGLYKALSADGNPTFATIERVLDALGVSTTIAVRTSSERRRAAGDEVAGRAAGVAATAPSASERDEPPKGRIEPGSARGIFMMSDDFEGPLPEFRDHM